jgi:formylglycine-generating enzyme required for sulfatase activity
MKRAANRGLVVVALGAFATTLPSNLGAFQGSGTSKGAAAKTSSAPKPGDSKVNPKDGLKYLWIPAGKFTEGCSPGDNQCYEDEFPDRKITLTKGFWLGDTEVTQAAYQKIMGKNPSWFKGANLPAEEMTWDDADGYCSAIGGRLPTEAEWEYAARAGTTEPRYGDLDKVAWYYGNAGLKSHPVGLKEPNAFGLHDMLGNVLEWTHTWYTVQLSQETTDPQGPGEYTFAEFKSLKGGSWWDVPKLVRSSFRSRIEPEHTDRNIGFRCVSR